jgi:hypothetical protein
VSLKSCQPEHDRGEDYATSEDHRVLVVSGCEAAPVLHVVERSFHDVAVLVVAGVEVDRTTAAGSLALAVPDLVRRFGDDRNDPTRP